ncbi:MAG: nitroreductase family protein [Deltaproteobacteria bacterium]|nr:nitroreductase family protein [Deltaproteobacteria bacterium]
MKKALRKKPADGSIQPPKKGAPFNPVEDVIFRRRSVRYYKKKQVPEYLIQRILEAGRFAPSAGNAQPWKFIVVQDREMIDEMTVDVVRQCKKFKKMLDYTQPGRERRAVSQGRILSLRPTAWGWEPAG